MDGEGDMTVTNVSPDRTNEGSERRVGGLDKMGREMGSARSQLVIARTPTLIYFFNFLGMKLFRPARPLQSYGMVG